MTRKSQPVAFGERFHDDGPQFYRVGRAKIEKVSDDPDEGYRVGDLATGTREFRPLTGIVTERWVADTTGYEDAPVGRIELITAFVARELPEE